MLQLPAQRHCGLATCASTRRCTSTQPSLSSPVCSLGAASCSLRRPPHVASIVCSSLLGRPHGPTAHLQTQSWPQRSWGRWTGAQGSRQRTRRRCWRQGRREGSRRSWTCVCTTCAACTTSACTLRHGVLTSESLWIVVALPVCEAAICSLKQMHVVPLRLQPRSAPRGCAAPWSSQGEGCHRGAARPRLGRNRCARVGLHIAGSTCARRPKGGTVACCAPSSSRVRTTWQSTS
mmetsp:Transcript_113672/g.316563  ORF Transcript_113672/g.316563 Transcript_113672/m.316563 type:complete len:234 (+) Transcript_113672:860-1561(+)